jgi:hypothetical protein
MPSGSSVSASLAFRGASRWGLVRDISRSGIGLLLACPLEPGEVVLIGLPWADARLGRGLPARVARSTDQGDGSWAVGCAFDELLADEQLSALLSATPPN